MARGISLSFESRVGPFTIPNGNVLAPFPEGSVGHLDLPGAAVDGDRSAAGDDVLRFGVPEVRAEHQRDAGVVLSDRGEACAARVVGYSTGRRPNSSRSRVRPSSYGLGKRAGRPADGESTATASPRRGLSG